MILGQLKELGELRTSGILSESEFQIEKEKLLDQLNNLDVDGRSLDQVALEDVPTIENVEELSDLELGKSPSKAKLIAKGGARTIGAFYTLGMSEVAIRSRRKRKAAEAELEELKKKIKDDSGNNESQG